MKVILLQDIESLGKKNDVKEVADGHARNFLFPKKLAEVASEAALKQLEVRRKEEEKKAEADLADTEMLVSQLDGQEVEISAKADEGGKLYGSITAAKIAKALKDKGFEVKPKQVKLTEPIKEAGESEINLEFPHGLEAKIKLIVAEELGEKTAGAEEEI